MKLICGFLKEVRNILIHNGICEISLPKLKSTITRSGDVQIGRKPDRSNALGEIYRSVILFWFLHISSYWGRIWTKTWRIESADSPLSIGAKISHWGPQYLEIWPFRNHNSNFELLSNISNWFELIWGFRNGRSNW